MCLYGVQKIASKPVCEQKVAGGLKGEWSDNCGMSAPLVIQCQ